MAENAWPFYGTETNEAQFSKWARALADSGIISGLNLTPAGGLALNLSSGAALVRGVYYENTTTKSLTFGAAPTVAGQTRPDTVVLRLDQNLNTIQAIVKAGTASTSGGTPAPLTQNESVWEMLLGIVPLRVGNAAITETMLYQSRPTTGQRIPVVPFDQLPTYPADVDAVAFDVENRRLMYWNGSGWYDCFQFENMAGVIPVMKGGSGAQTNKGLQRAAEIFVQPGAPSHRKGRVWIPGTEAD